jgi:hypothetical protein
MGVGTGDATKEDPPAGFRVAFEQAIRGGPLVGVDFEVFCFGINGDVFVGFFLHVDLRTYHAVKDLVGSFGELRGVIGHDRLGFGQE